MSSSASFHQKNIDLDVSINHGTQLTFFGLLMFKSKIHFFIEFWHPFF